ncbi:MAG: hypothetical protein MHMPM18_003173 [Marteilia pararefringens]
MVAQSLSIELSYHTILKRPKNIERPMSAILKNLPNSGYIYQSQIEIYIVSFLLFSVTIRLVVSIIKIFGCIRIPFHLSATRGI